MPSSRLESVLAVFAHPDDELFHGGATLAHLAERGARVTLACATKGEAGKAHPSVGPVDDLGARRAQELAEACAVLGIGEPRFLGFRDSARKERLRRDDPRALVNVDMLEVETEILRVIREVEPGLVITFDPHGGYYHPDHIAVHRAATAAFYSSGSMGARAPRRLLYSTFGVDAYREHARRIQGAGITDGLDPDVFAVRPETAAFVFDARPHWDRKVGVFNAHRSAFGRDANKLEGFRPILEEEVFTIGGLRGPLPRWPLRDLLE